jgi:hypothetical protein
LLGWPLLLPAYALFLALFLAMRLVWVAYWALAGPLALVFILLWLLTRVEAMQNAHDFLVNLIDIERLDSFAAAPVEWVDRLRGVEW